MYALQPHPGLLALCGLTAGLAAWTKNEGAVLVIGASLALLALACGRLRMEVTGFLRRRPCRPTGRARCTSSSSWRRRATCSVVALHGWLIRRRTSPVTRRSCNTSGGRVIGLWKLGYRRAVHWDPPNPCALLCPLSRAYRGDAATRRFLPLAIDPRRPTARILCGVSHHPVRPDLASFVLDRAAGAAGLSPASLPDPLRMLAGGDGTRRR